MSVRTSKGVALITGASRGIGKAIAIKYAALGYDLFLTCHRNIEQLDQMAKELVSTNGIQCETFAGDLGHTETVGRLFHHFKEVYDDLDVLVNNAGISYVNLFQDMIEVDFDHLMNTNVKAAFLMSQRAVAYFMKKKQGHIINISSVWGQHGASCEVAYCTSKGALNSMTKALAKELAPSGIQVNAIAPGAIDTDMNAWMSEAERQALEDEIPMGRLGLPREVASLCAYLIKPDAKYINGQILTVDGAWLS